MSTKNKKILPQCSEIFLRIETNLTDLKNNLNKNVDINTKKYEQLSDLNVNVKLLNQKLNSHLNYHNKIDNTYKWFTGIAITLGTVIMNLIFKLIGRN